MNGSNLSRRNFLARIAGTATGAAAVALLPTGASALDRPAGKVILTVTGALGVRNDGNSASFDIGLLDQMPQHTFSTKTPWYPQGRKFTGVLVSELLKSLDSRATSLNAMALNDYRVEIAVDDLTRYGAMIASLLDDKPIPVRDKGPLLIMYPFDDRPELRTAVFYSRAVWQLKSLELR